ncbi:MAG: hypothetical protein IKB93_10420 [Clostridia bacterium]|nr:hypothetical protein [Clostridia bacterium]
MVYKNIEFHNVEEFIQTENGVSWLRFPLSVCDKMDSEVGKQQCRNSTGVELRFIIKSENVTLRMRDINPKAEKTGGFHIYRGGIQGGWEDHENNTYISRDICEFKIKKTDKLPQLIRMSKEMKSEWNPNLVRVIFDRSNFEFIDIIGDVEAPQKIDTPQKTILFYGSSITHGSNSIDASHAWSSIVAYNLSMDCLNKGQAGSCMMEPVVVDYIAEKGMKNEWDIAVLELGINVLSWEREKIRERVSYAVKEIATKNMLKKVFVISPIYCCDDFDGEGNAQKWRDEIADVVKTFNYENVTYIDGSDLIGEMSLISADLLHPSIYGISRIADKLTEIIKNRM